MTITKRAMLSRGVSVIRKKTLIINLPGSKRQWKRVFLFIIDQLPHGLDNLRGKHRRLREETKRGGQCMDISPIIISMKTATIAILFTFIFRTISSKMDLYIVTRRNKNLLGWDLYDAISITTNCCGGFFCCLYFRIIWTSRKIHLKIILGSRLHFSWPQRSLRAVDDVISIDVPFCKRCPGTD